MTLQTKDGIVKFGDDEGAGNGYRAEFNFNTGTYDFTGTSVDINWAELSAYNWNLSSNFFAEVYGEVWWEVEGVDWMIYPNTTFDNDLTFAVLKGTDGGRWDDSGIGIGYNSIYDVTNISMSDYGTPTGYWNGADGELVVGYPTLDYTKITDGAIQLSGGTAPIINEFSTDTTLAGNSDSALPTEKAVKTYVDNKFQGHEQIYRAIITQSGTNAPTLLELRDDFGVTLTATYEDVGSYAVDVTSLSLVTGQAGIGLNKNILAENGFDDSYSEVTTYFSSDYATAYILSGEQGGGLDSGRDGWKETREGLRLTI